MGLALLVALPAWSQVEPSATGPAITPTDESPMQTPPPVSGEAYPTVVGAEMRSNYLTAGMTFTTAYDDNVLPGASAKPIADVTYSMWPTISLDQTNTRQRRTFIYSPGFTIYQSTSALNAVDQNAALDFQYRLSPHATISVRDSFLQSSNVLSQFNSTLGESISGSGQPPPAAVIVPFADQLSNLVNVVASYQFSRNSMVGAGGSFSSLSYPDPTEAAGLHDSNSRGGAAFYSHRLSSTQYLGAAYQYSRSQANAVPTPSETQTHAFSSFYTVYLKRSLSLSLEVGPQHFDASQSSSPPSSSWVPAALASIGWQRSHTNLAASYSRTVTGGGGLAGAFESSSANASASWQVEHAWVVASSASYAINKDLTPLFSSTSSSGHSILGAISLHHSVGERIRVEGGYDRMHESYSGIAVISAAPDIDRGFISVSYQFTRALGR